MVGLTKNILRKNLGWALLRFSELEVVLKKRQAILNNRPLCYQGKEIEKEMLTPIHLIFGHRLPQLPDIPDDQFEEDNDASLRLQYVETKLNGIWDCWKEEYRIGLREFHRPKVHKKGSNYEVKPGDIVLIENKGGHRGMWKKARPSNYSKEGNSCPWQQLELCDEISKKPSKEEETTPRQSTRLAALNAKAIISTITEDVNQEELA